MSRRLTVAEVPVVLNKLVHAQDNKCAVCGHYFTKRDRAVLDHCHDKGYIRGALHNSCNGAEGRVKIKAQLGHTGVTPAKLVIGLGKYLEKHETPQLQFLHPSHLTDDEKRLKRNKRAVVLRKRRKKT